MLSQEIKTCQQQTKFAQKPQCCTTDVPRDRQEDVNTQEGGNQRGTWLGEVVHDFSSCALEAGAGQPGPHSKFQDAAVYMVLWYK